MTGWRMRPTASALGVIAIVSVMITVTASESSSDTIEHSINHPEVNEENQRNQSDPIHENSTDSEMFHDSQLIQPRFDDSLNATRLVQDISAELQRDQSAAVSFAAEQNEVEREPEQSEQRPVERNNKIQGISRIFPTSTESVREIVSSTASSKSEDELNRVQVDEQASYTLDEQGITNGLKVEIQRDFIFTTTSSRETIATDSRQIEEKNVEDIRAISFQVPAAGEETRQQEQPRNPGETRKDHSRPVNNLLLAGGKSTKGFYEIKPSIKTEMEDDQTVSSTQRPLPGKKFVLPSVDSAFGKFGPYFEDGDQDMNITARIGSKMLLDCKIGMLGDKEVTWLQQHSKDSLRLLTVGKKPYSADQRITLNFRYPSNWRLQILYATPRDSGLYKCQVATHPPLVKKINVVVTAPELTITDDSGRVVPKERHLKAGSALKLRCEARDVIESLNEAVVWTRGDETLTEDVSENRTTETSSGKEVLVIVSTLIVERATPRHAGNYSCVVPGKAKTTIAVHVLNGELPAAVHDGNGVSRAFLNLWLIHLTISYVFSR
uniref:uncharacterized protein LOC117601239 n=1 Tax=Osmia lignaria TaxID=473952 RepID=UPI0014796188|nr:uncharacterized protein LOC117601239 [Osmia lignaria]XP_034173654.1 uncharacterized protein LOC117601239 [Osmia lignaria]XP_034173655.1 uncharacterized protein LOC117601239 [Osmia lignaria]XP_034173656.1 uncharacterized protein LOC117601239 [Osmia lignaria]XP_034173657.1 uncharacterized protein LOC117601239 [Osmia lignaria]XP_034173658.1 uncharacterized protein LOC117601239 [Osmia lignaria]